MIPDSAHVVLKSTPELAEALQTISDSRHDADTQAVPDPPHGADAETQDSPWITAKIEKDTILITATGKSRHSAFPEGSVNAIHELMRFLGGLTPLPEKDRELFRRLAYLSQEYHGNTPALPEMTKYPAEPPVPPPYWDLRKDRFPSTLTSDMSSRRTGMPSLQVWHRQPRKTI